MRIIGGHDYYDTILSFGRDDAVLYLRNGDERRTEEEMHDDLLIPRALCGARLGERDAHTPNWMRRDGHQLVSVEVHFNGRVVRHRVSHAAVVLCGILHRGVHVETSEPYGFVRPLGERWIWSAEALRDFARENDLEINEGRKGVQKVWSGNTSRRQIDVPVLDLEDWFQPERLSDRSRAALVEERITLAFHNPLEMHPHNDKRQELCWRVDQAGLREMGFAKAVDPSTAFQEISMWKGGVLPSDGPAIVEITDDKVKIAKHGFHHPTSFRKAKTKA